MSAICSHTDSIELTELPDEIAGCTDCLAIGGTWLHLRMCQSCGHIACCDSSPNRHVSATACTGPTATAWGGPTCRRVLSLSFYTGSSACA